jgi:hypothetical protein
MQTRYDIQKEVIFLAGRAMSPTRSDVHKAIQILRYLKAAPDLGPTFYTTDGVLLVAHVDAAYGVHANGRSQSGFCLSIGRCSAPFFVYAGAQNACVSLGSMHAEYVSLTEVGKKILEYRYFLDDIGFSRRFMRIINHPSTWLQPPLLLKSPAIFI